MPAEHQSETKNATRPILQGFVAPVIGAKIIEVYTKNPETGDVVTCPTPIEFNIPGLSDCFILVTPEAGKSCKTTPYNTRSRIKQNSLPTPSNIFQSLLK